jgi:voltage-gated potassium channel
LFDNVTRRAVRFWRRRTDHHTVHHGRRAAEYAAASALRRLRLAMLLMFGVIVYGTLGYCFIERMPPFDALYQTVTTMSTVGFMEVHPLSTVGRVFTMSLIFSGTGVLFYVFGTTVELLVSEQWSHWRQRLKMLNKIDEMSGHYIICGFGRIGRQLATDFRDSQVPFLVVDNNAERCAKLLEEGMPFIEGDATLDEVLLEAGIERARALVGALNSDADNVMTVVTARGLNPKLHIVARAALPEAEKKLLRAGADEVISPYVVGARRISLSMLRPAVSGFLNAVLYDAELQAEMTEVVIEADSPFVERTLADSGMAHGHDVLPIALMRGGRLMFSPLPDTVLHAGDALIIVTPIESLKVGRS